MSSSRPCDLCGETDPARFRIWYDGEIKLHKCRSCGFVGQYPGPGAYTIVDSYEEAYTLHFLDKGQKWAHPYWSDVHADTVRRIREVVPGGRLLDIGCGDGHFLSHCIEAGFEASGVEYCRARAEYAAEVTGGEVAQGRYSREMFPEDSFDVITLTQVLEHIPGPREALLDIHYHLKPGGLLVVEVPSINSPHFLAFRITRIKWFAKPPDGVEHYHTGYYSPTTLKRMCAECGFEPVSTLTGRWGLKYHGPLGTLGRILDPVFALAGVGGILHMARAKT